LEATNIVEVGFCGPGLMGAPMIRHLLAAGHRVGVWNRTRAKAEALEQDGARVVDTPRELAEQVDTVFVCVLDGRAVGDVVFGAHGLLAGDANAPRVKRIVDHSSIAPAATRDYAARAAALGVGWIDAPVSGGVPGAQAGTLAVMAGGNAADLDAVRPLIDRYASRITHMGDAGAGQTAKLCNQAIVTATVTAIAEAVGLAQASGIDAASGRRAGGRLGRFGTAADLRAADDVRRSSVDRRAEHVSEGCRCNRGRGPRHGRGDARSGDGAAGVAAGRRARPCRRGFRRVHRHPAARQRTRRRDMSAARPKRYA
jgi:3-hydroxyisobutyrate dehydrogenase-like beta-hydroxyacid dehydrogenase